MYHVFICSDSFVKAPIALDPQVTGPTAHGYHPMCLCPLRPFAFCSKQTPSSRGSGVESALRFDDLHRRLRLLGYVKNRAPMLHLLQVLAGTGTSDKRHMPGIAQMPPRVFSEPSSGLSGIDRVGQSHDVGAMPAGRPSASGVSNGREGEDERYAGAITRRAEGQSVRRPRRGTEVTDRALLRGILYAFQVRFCPLASAWRWFARIEETAARLWSLTFVQVRLFSSLINKSFTTKTRVRL